MTELRFAFPAPASTALVFGATTEGPAEVDLRVTGALPALVARLRLIPQTKLAVVGALPGPALVVAVTPSVPLFGIGTFPALTLVAEARYVSRTQRPTVSQRFSPWHLAAKTQAGPTQAHQDAQGAPVGWRTHWQPAQRREEPRVQRQPPVLVAAWVAHGAGFQDGRSAPPVDGRAACRHPAPGPTAEHPPSGRQATAGADRLPPPGRHPQSQRPPRTPLAERDAGAAVVRGCDAVGHALALGLGRALPGRASAPAGYSPSAWCPHRRRASPVTRPAGRWSSPCPWRGASSSAAITIRTGPGGGRSSCRSGGSTSC